MVQQRQQHGDQCRFLAAVQARGGGEGRGRLVDQGAVEPQRAGGIDEVLERGGHVAEAGRTAQRQSSAVAQVVEAGIDGALLGNLGVDGFAGGRDGRYGSQARLDAGSRLNARGELLGHGTGRTVARIIENQHIG
ncbi:hypothetical protein Q427_28060 [Halomonas sp. BC04]|nr:hypothetical protein Q427_28060 [Halomonas sp. BC04]